MAQQGDTRTINGVPHTYVNGKWVAVGEMSATGRGLSGGYVGSGQAGAIGSVLGATGATESPAGKAAIDRLQNQADRQACNDSGGFYTQGGECLSGKEAENQVYKILNNPDAPSVLVQRANTWVERNDQYGWLQDFINIFRPYIEGQDTDDIDRINRQEEADAFMDILRGVQNGTVDPDELRNFEFEYLSEVPGWNDYFQGVLGNLDGNGDEEEQPDEFQGLYDKYGKDIVDDAREKYDEVVKVLGEAAEDPFGAIEDLINTVSSGTAECREANVPDWIRNCVTVGVLYGIPGLPLPPIPGVMGTTIGELEEGFKNIGRSVQDILDGAETCGEEGDELCTWEDAFGSLKDWIIEKAGDAIDDITNPDDIGDWITGILGPALGGLIFTEVGDQISDILFPVTDIDDDDTTQCTEGKSDGLGNCVCPDGLIENADGSCTREPTAATTCDDENATNFGQEGECKYADQPTVCDDPEATNFGEEGDCQYASEDATPPSSGVDIDELCSKPRPEGPYTFETQTWDRYCSGGTGVSEFTDDQCNEENPASTPLQCGWVECPEGGFAPTEEECGTDAEVTLGPAPAAGGGSGGGGGGGGGGFEGDVRGLSYQAQPVPGLMSGAPVDAIAQLDSFISRQLQKRGRMLT